MAGIPPEAQEAIQDAATQTKELMTSFTQSYLSAYVQMKIDKVMNEIASTAIPGAPEISIDGIMGEDDAKGNEADEKNDGGDGLEEKKDMEPIASGISLVGFRLLTGPDKLDHRYYDISCVSIKPEDSVITRVTRTHTQLSRQAQQLLKVQNAPKLQFPGKKWGKKGDEYYKNRFGTMKEFYVNVSNSPISSNDLFLKMFNLKYDPMREEQMEVFHAGLGPVAEEKGLDLDQVLESAEEIGIDSEEPELLKFIAIESIAVPLSPKVKSAIEENSPGFLPQKMKNRGIKFGEMTLNQTVATAVDTSWTALGVSFETLSKAIGTALDTGIEPIKTLLMKAAEPMGNVIREKFKLGDEPPPETTGQEINLDRYPWIQELLEGVKSGNLAASLTAFEKKVGSFKKKEDFSGYLLYDFGSDWIQDLEIPCINDVVEPHEHLVNALLEAWAVLSLGIVKALKPLFELQDKMAKNFDQSTFQSSMSNAVREGGMILTQDYFSLPRKLKKAVKNLGGDTTKIVLKLAQKTVESGCNMLGQIAQSWQPQNAGEVTQKFFDSLVNAGTSFGNITATRFLMTIRKGTQQQLSLLVMGEISSVIDEVAGTLDELVQQLPPPINEHIQPSQICKRVMTKLVTKACVFGVSKIARKTEDDFYNVAEVQKIAINGPKSEPKSDDNDGAGDEPDQNENNEAATVESDGVDNTYAD